MLGAGVCSIAIAEVEFFSNRRSLIESLDLQSYSLLVYYIYNNGLGFRFDWANWVSNSLTKLLDIEYLSSCMIRIVEYDYILY